jgi:hypothetical protein
MQTKRPPLTAKERDAIGTAKTQAVETLERSEVRPRSRLLVYGGMALGALAIAAVTLAGRWQGKRHAHASSSTAAHAVAAPAPAPTPAPALDTPAPNVDTPAPVVDTPAATPAVDAAPIAETTAPKSKTRPTKRVAKAAPTATPAAHELTASEVAALYGSVGRNLKEVANRPGVDALWKRYHAIKIQTSLGTVEDRKRTQRALRELLDDASRL